MKCPVCGSDNDQPCLEASEYFPATRNDKGEVEPGERREHGLYFARKPHLLRVMDQ
jgi:hypothetical protein